MKKCFYPEIFRTFWVDNENTTVVLLFFIPVLWNFYIRMIGNGIVYIRIYMYFVQTPRHTV